MHDPNSTPKPWHQRTWIRVVVLLLLPSLAIGLYLVATRIALQQPAQPSLESPIED